MKWSLTFLWALTSGNLQDMPDDPKRFPVPLVGESHYQQAIGYCGEGEAVQLLREGDNPHDPDAIVAVCHGDTIGYVPRDSFLQRAIHRENKGITARIQRITGQEKRQLGVVLEVTLAGDPVGEREFPSD